MKNTQGEYVPDLIRVPTEQLPSKRDLPGYVNKMVEEIIESGVMNVGEVFARLKFINETTTAAIKNPALMSAVMDEIHLQDNKEAVYFDKMKISKSSTGTKYDFSKDDRWTGLQEDLEAATKEVDRIKGLIKDREEFLVVVARNSEDTFDGDGVLIERPPVKTPSKDILVTRF